MWHHYVQGAQCVVLLYSGCIVHRAIKFRECRGLCNGIKCEDVLQKQRAKDLGNKIRRDHLLSGVVKVAWVR